MQFLLQHRLDFILCEKFCRPLYLFELEVTIRKTKAGYKNMNETKALQN